MDKTIKISEANRETVFDLLDDMRVAYEKILNEYPRELKPVDVMMAGHNFYKLVLTNVIEDFDPAAKRLMLLTAKNTFSQAIDAMIQKGGV